MNKEKCLIIGLGNIGLMYDVGLEKKYILSHSRAVEEHPCFELVGGVDKSDKRRDLFKDIYRKPAFESLEEAFKKTIPTVIIIATSSNTHASIFNEITKTILPKAILCEKPLDHELKEAEKMLDLCSKKNIKLYANYIRRCDPTSIEIKKRIKNNSINKPIKGIVWYSKGLKNNGSHFINLLEDWFGECKNLYKISSGKYYDEIDDKDYDFILNFKEADIIFSASLEKSYSYNSIELFSSNGRLAYKNGGEEVYWQPVINSGFKKNKILGKKEILEESMHRYQYNVLDCMNQALQGKDSPISTGIDALSTLKIINRIINNG